MAKTTSLTPNRCLTLRDVAERMGVNPRTILNWLRAGSFLRPLPFSRTKRWDAAGLERWIQEQQEGARHAKA